MLKKYLLLFLYTMFFTMAQSQTGIYNTGTEITNMGTGIHIQGSYVNGPKGAVANGGTMYIRDSLVNNSSNHLFITDTGKVVLNGKLPQVISGSFIINFYQLEVNKPSGEVILYQDIRVKDSLFLKQGNLFLNSKNISLDTLGILAGENNANRVYGASGVIKAVRFLDSSKARLANNIAGLGLYISSREQFGFVTIERGHGQQVYTCDSSILRYFNFIPSSSIGSIDTLRISYFDQEMVSGESNYKIYSSADDGIDWRNKGGLVNLASNYIQTTTVSPPEVGKARFSVFPTENFATCLPNDPQYISAVFLVASNVIDGDSTHFVQLTSPVPAIYSWDFGDGNTSVTDFSPYHIYHLPVSSVSSEYQITMTVSNGACSDTRKKKIMVSPQPPLKGSTNGLFIGFDELSLYPNPNQGSFSIEVKVASDSDISMNVMNAQGKVMEERVVRASRVKEGFDLSEYASGIYYVKVQVGEDYRVLRWVKM